MSASQSQPCADGERAARTKAEPAGRLALLAEAEALVRHSLARFGQVAAPETVTRQAVKIINNLRLSGQRGQP